MQEKTYKCYDLNTNPMIKRKFIAMNEYGYNFEIEKNEFVNYEKKCSRMLYSDVNKGNKKGKR